MNEIEKNQLLDEIIEAEKTLNQMRELVKISPDEECKQMAIKNVEGFVKHIEYMKKLVE